MKRRKIELKLEKLRETKPCGCKVYDDAIWGTLYDKCPSHKAVDTLSSFMDSHFMVGVVTDPNKDKSSK